MNDIAVAYERSPLIKDAEWKDWQDRIEFRALAPTIWEALKASPTGIAIGPLRHEYQSIDMYGLPSTRVIVRAQMSTIIRHPVMIGMMPTTEWYDAKLHWTFWRRLKFLFTGRLPKD